jgi:hypothetical protein
MSIFINYKILASGKRQAASGKRQAASGKRQGYSYLNTYAAEIFRRGKFILALQNNAIKNVRVSFGRGGLLEAVRAHVFVFHRKWIQTIL